MVLASFSTWLPYKIEFNVLSNNKFWFEGNRLSAEAAGAVDKESPSGSTRDKSGPWLRNEGRDDEGQLLIKGSDSAKPNSINYTAAAKFKPFTRSLPNLREMSLQQSGNSWEKHGLELQSETSSSDTSLSTSEKPAAKRNNRQTPLEQHCAFFDRDQDGIIWPLDTFISFRKLGFNLLISIFGTFAIHGGLSYATQTSWIPDPRLPVNIPTVHRAKHGSDSGTYDNGGDLVPQRFEATFTTYASEGDYLTFRDLIRMWIGQRCVMDFFGVTASVLEWLALYLMLWPQDGRMRKEDVLGVFDGSIFYTVAERHSKGKM
ncbi:Caleosin-domain-containing protein [Microthyrium microscopicum]|uniref:Caleosin-domain-containing protein n=1 Tax=Microthyrium microscopicum TaxID=703497 RepID=A0A6A6UK47_9PEZI|nr:Caleosin-domain-containing protein [Microthyrium microscopicum]